MLTALGSAAVAAGGGGLALGVLGASQASAARVPALGKPRCVGMLTPAKIARIFHVGHLSGPNWHTDGVATSYCDYGPYPNQLEVSVLQGSTSHDYSQMVADTDRGKKTYAVPSLGSHATAIDYCVPVIGCHPIVVALSRGNLIYISDQLSNTSWKQLPEVTTLAKKLEALA